MSKRKAEHIEDNTDAVDVPIGPGPAKPPTKKKKVRELKFENLYLDKLPSAQLYEVSYMHADTVTHCIVVPIPEYIITASVDGFIKFWKKQPTGIEFVKKYKAHSGMLTGFAVSSDETMLCTSSVDKTVKIFDIFSFDMINMLKLSFTPSCCQWIFKKGTSTTLIAIGSKDDSNIRIYSTNAKVSKEAGEAEPNETLSLHKSSVKIIQYNKLFEVVISTDSDGMIEYWESDTFKHPESLPWQFKSDTDLYEFAKNKTYPTAITISKDGKRFASFATDRVVRIFNFATGKLYRSYDESLDVLNDVQRNSDEGSPYKLEAIDFGRRLVIEKDMDKRINEIIAPNVVFDESGYFIIYGTLIGIKIVNIYTNKVVRILGRDENARFTQFALYQGKTEGSLEFETRKLDAEYDPTLFTSAYNKERFYMFSKREPEEEGDNDVGRDILNEKPKSDVTSGGFASQRLGNYAILYTSMGDIHIKLFPVECPKTIENFTTHSKNGYYNGLLFHRVIKGFMIQTGDPLGDGTGGSSIWGEDFEDEFHRDLRHDRPFTVSMANTGQAKSNGSQFFITTVPVTRLDSKHTVFGRVVKGMEVVLAIENVHVDKNDCPDEEDIKIMNIKIETRDNTE